MKKNLKRQIALAGLIIFPLVVIVFTQADLLTSFGGLFKAGVTGTPAVPSPGSTPSSQPAQPPPAPLPIPPALQQQKDAAIATREARSGDLNTAADALKAAVDKQKQAAANGQDTTTLDADVKNKQDLYNKAKTNLDIANGNVTDASNKIEATSEMKTNRLNEYYQGLIDANKVVGDGLKTKTGTTPEETKVIVQQRDANAKYDALLKAKQAVDVCQVTTPPCGGLAGLQAAQDAAAAALKVVIGDLTHAEEIINMGMTFPVSQIFAPAGQAPKKLSLLDVTNKVANWMITLASSLAVTALIIGGFMMIISGGSEERLETGKTIFTYSLIGLAVTLMAYGIITAIQSLFA